jgi:hypothetical protein
MDNFDVIVVGAGMGGLISGAILAKKENMKVLVLEKNSRIGGRIISFGKGHGGNISCDEFEKLLLDAGASKIIKAEPDIKTIIEEKNILEDHVIDGGWHGMSGANRCRYSLIARGLGYELPVEPVVGFGYWNDKKNCWSQLPDLVKDWPRESIVERNRVAFNRMLISNAQAAEYDHVDFKTFMNSVTQDQLVRDYYLMMGRWQYGVNNAENLSAGEWIRCNNSTAALGRHLITGGGMGQVKGGYGNIAKVFAQIIEDCGGEVRRNNRVKEVIIDNYNAKGVIVETDKGDETITAPNVIVNVPWMGLYNIIDKQYFSKDLQIRMKNFHPLGAIVGYMGLKKPLETHAPKSQWLKDFEPIDVPGCSLDPHVFGWEQTSIVDPTRAPADKCLASICVIISSDDPNEIHNTPALEKLSDQIMEFFDGNYPGFRDNLEWWFTTIGIVFESLANMPGQVGERRLPPQHPAVRNLFFTGDSVEHWDVGSNGAAHAAVLTASKLSGRDYMSSLLPPYWR